VLERHRRRRELAVGPARRPGGGHRKGRVSTGPGGRGGARPLEATVAAHLIERAPYRRCRTSGGHAGRARRRVSNAGAGWLGFFRTDAPARSTLCSTSTSAPMHLAHAASPTSEKALRRPARARRLHRRLVGVAEEVAYSTAKAAAGTSRQPEAEWTSDQVTVTLVSPGPVDTPFYLRRNRPYTHSWPRPIPRPRSPSHRAGHRNAPGRRGHTAWLGLAARLHGGWPWLYRALGGGPWQAP